MRIAFYPRLAWSGIRKNKELYIPYLLTCTGMIMMFYIVSYLYSSNLMLAMRGGAVIATLMGLGRIVVGAFSIGFLFYTHSFLIRRRKKEFGLYSILGMNKNNLAQVMIWESVMVAGISLTSGLILGIVFSKLAELLMFLILRTDVNYAMRISPDNIRQTITLYLVIFLLILVVTLWQVRMADPIQLLRSENTGERPPKANWPMALAGAVLLGLAYYLAVSIEDPISAILWFFVAVLLVIAGTYLLFVAGSVALCRMLQKNKKYYYKTNHFVSVSSMIYRMRRNGAGLASICILCTMVLVMLSSTVCLYGGMESSLRARYPRNIITDCRANSYGELREENIAPVRAAVSEVLEAHGQTDAAHNVLEYSYAALVGILSDGVVETGTSDIYNTYRDLWQIFIVPLADYNRLMGTQETLEAGEVLMCTTKMWFHQDSLQFTGTDQVWRVKKAESFVKNGVDSMQIIPSMFLFVEDVESFVEPLKGRADYAGDQLLQYDWIYGFDLDCSGEEQGTVFYEIQGKLNELAQAGYSLNCTVESIALNRDDFAEIYGGLFFLGILLSIVFVAATTLIMYYKQISEGYEDQGRFEILQKVGMTKREVKKSINSQVMTVFFLPLIVAGIHLAFAFPFLYKGLMLLNFYNLWLLVWVAALAYLLFGVGYVIVYRITSRAYYHLVGGAN
ncbi:MAG: ABC transporter permease [bacterium]|nr:ABC transporter permease [bacterium]MCM1375828.1 ABC transporter permease [Muribaculum sp.]